MATANICENCRYWQNMQIIGLCKRYPQHENKARIDWCGEWAVALVTLPIVEMQPETQVARVKRKYTRRQNVEASA